MTWISCSGHWPTRPAAIESDWTVGSPYRLGHPAAERSLIEGENLVVERPSRLVQTMRALWGPDAERERIGFAPATGRPAARPRVAVVN